VSGEQHVVLPRLHTLMWDANLTNSQAAGTDNTLDSFQYTGTISDGLSDRLIPCSGAHDYGSGHGKCELSRARRQDNVQWDRFWKCEKRQCARFEVPVEDSNVGVLWVYSDPSDDYRTMNTFSEREYGSIATNICQRPGYIRTPNDFEARCEHDGTFRILSIGRDPITGDHYEHLEAKNAWNYRY
jgi:hypothetical protein